MTADVSKPTQAWPFMSTAAGVTEPGRIQVAVFDILQREGRSMHTGELARLLQVPLEQIFTAMHHPQHTGKVRFISTEGWSLPPAAEKSRGADQRELGHG